MYRFRKLYDIRHKKLYYFPEIVTSGGKNGFHVAQNRRCLSRISERISSFGSNVSIPIAKCIPFFNY